LYLYQGGPIERPGRVYDYVLARQGVIKRIENDLVRADHLIAPIGVELTGLHLQEYPLAPLCFKLPRISESLLWQVYDDARANTNLEHMYQFLWEPGPRRWQVLRPQQERSRSRVRYQTSEDPWLALDLHSHGTMAAFYSPTDDNDELGGRFYAVIGNLDRPRPQLVLRLGLYGHWIFNVPAEILFEGLGPFVQVPAQEFEENFQDYFVEEEEDPSSWWKIWRR
jgi:PRTRC genetic system protein A